MSFSSRLGAQTLLALQQQLVAEMLETGFGGSSLAGALLKPRMKSGREISAQALTGRIRSDAGMLRQASSNGNEAGSIAEIIREGRVSLPIRCSVCGRQRIRWPQERLCPLP